MVDAKSIVVNAPRARLIKILECSNLLPVRAPYRPTTRTPEVSELHILYNPTVYSPLKVFPLAFEWWANYHGTALNRL